MKKKYTKAKVEIISMKTEAGICTGSPKTQGTVPYPGAGEGDQDPIETAKAYDGNGVTDFSFDPTPSTKE